MKKNATKTLVYILALCVIFIPLVLLCYSVFVYLSNPKKSTYVTCGDGVFKTVAHVDVDTERFSCIYSDLDADIAYYILEPHANCVDVGDRVYSIENVEYAVTDVDTNGFFFEYDDSIHTGLSGTSVLDTNGEIVGYICEIINGKKVYCIWR